MLSIDKEMLVKGVNLSDSEYPIVVIKEREIGRELKGFLGRRFSVEKIFGQVLRQLGFSKDDIIVLKNIDYNVGINAVSFEYSVNLLNDSYNKITLDFNYFRKLIVSSKDMDIMCECSCTSVNDVRVYLKQIDEKIDGSREYTRKYGYSYSEYIINRFGSSVKLLLRRDIDSNCSELMSIENDLKIEEYFKNLNTSIDIDVLYKDLECYLGDIDSYKEIRLEVSENRDNKKINTGLLVLENGICKEFMISRNDRCVYLNNNGEWSYNFNGRFYNISSLGSDDGRVNYNISADNDSILKHVMDTKDYVKDVINEVDDTKKLVRTMFNKDKR